MGMAWTWLLQGRVLQDGRWMLIAWCDKGFQERPEKHIIAALSWLPFIRPSAEVQPEISRRLSQPIVCVRARRWWWVEAASLVTGTRNACWLPQREIRPLLLRTHCADFWILGPLITDIPLQSLVTQPSADEAYLWLFVTAEISSTRRCLEHLLLEDGVTLEGVLSPNMHVLDIKATRHSPVLGCTKSRGR